MWRQSSAKLFLIFTAFEYLLYVSCAELDVCATATNIGSYKRSVAYILNENEPPQCDQSITNDAWYRFDAPTGNKMPEMCIEVYHCGSSAPVWMNGTHPTAATPGPVTRTVCARKTPGKPCCEWTSEIKVKWCQNATTRSEYFVYQLKRPDSCDVSYCAGNRLKCSGDCAWNDIISNCSCPAIPSIKAPVLSEPFISAAKSVTDPRGRPFMATKFSINCTVGYPKQKVDDGARFFAALLSNGNAIAKITGTSLEPALSFEEEFLHGFLGTNITCWASAYWLSSDPPRGPALMSNSKWFGLQPVTEKGQVIKNPVIKDGEVFPFKIQPNFPITSPHCFTDPPGTPCHPIYTFHIFANKAGRLCNCRFILTPSKNSSDLITVSPAPIMGSRVKPFFWEIAFGNHTDDHTDTIFEDYKIPSIMVEIEDSGTRPLCSSTGDPHITTFAAGPSQTRLYYNMYLSGDFSLVKSTTRLFEIQVRQFPCMPLVSCNCGVMVREGNNVLGIYSCQRGEGAQADSTPMLIRPLLDLGAPGGQIETTGSGWTITMLSGVKINVDRGYREGVLDIHVIGLRSEAYGGLCSYKGTQTANCTTDCEQYRIPEKDSLFNYNSSNIPKCHESYVVPTCDCHRTDGDNSINVTCSPPDQSNLLKTSYNCEPPPEREVPEPTPLPDDNGPVIDGPVWNNPHVYPNGSSVVPVRPTPRNNISEPSAKEECNKALAGSTVYALCRDQKGIEFDLIINGCVADIQLTGDLSPARSVHAQLERICIYTYERAQNETSRGFDPPSDNAKDKSDQLWSNICPMQCSNRGKCVNSSCVCDSGYIGSDCSLPKGYVPAVRGLLSQVCTLSATTNCRKIYVQTAEVLSGYNASCKIKDPASVTKYDSSPIASGGVIICSLMFEPSPGTYTVSISIDGKTYSVELLYTIRTADSKAPVPAATTAKIPSNVETTVPTQLPVSAATTAKIPSNVETTVPTQLPVSAATTAKIPHKNETTFPTKPPAKDTTLPDIVACPDLKEIWDEFQQCLDAIRKKTIH